MNAREAQQVFDGAMLSDAGVYLAHGGGLNEQAYFELGLSGWKHDDWLKEVSGAIEALGAGSSLNDISYRTKTAANGVPYEDCRLKTRTHPLFTLTRRKWYAGNIKVVLEDLALTPLLLAHWFTGDGTSFFGACSIPNLVEVKLCTHSFTYSEVVHLSDLLKQYGIHTSVKKDKNPTSKGSGFYIRIRDATSVNKLMDIVELLTVQSYKYKIKRPWLNKRGPKAGQSYIRRWVPKQGWQLQEV